MINSIMLELTEESYRIPWLIWIQFVVLFLLLALLFFFTVLPIDPDHHHDDRVVTTSATASSSYKGFFFHEIQQIDKPLTNNHDSTTAPLLTNGQHPTQGGQNQTIKGETGTGSSMRVEEIMEGESSSLSFHPCHYFQLATVAFLKCFGLDSTSDSSSNRKRRKRKES